MASYAIRLARLEAAQRPAEPMRILVSFIDPQSHESVAMVAMEANRERRHFDRAAGETQDTFKRRVHDALGWDANG
jgi:hypothetical protein